MNEPQNETEANQQAEALWLRERRNTIGASDIPIILGVSTYKDRITLWEEMIGQREPEPPTYRQRKGHYMEPFIAQAYTEFTGVPLYDPGDYHMERHPEFPHYATTLDRRHRWEQGIPVELKDVGDYSAQAWKDSDELLSHQLQCQWQMYVTGAKKAHLFGLPNCEPCLHEFDYRPDTIEAILPDVEEFWLCVCSREMPEPIDGGSLKAWERLIAVIEGKTVDLETSMALALERWRHAREVIHRETEVMEEAKLELATAMGDAEYAMVCGQRLSYKLQKRDGYVRLPYPYRDELEEWEDENGEPIQFRVTEPSTFRVLRECKR